MSAEPSLLLEVLPRGTGWALDLGGSNGALREAVVARGYRYVNLDICSAAPGEPDVLGDAHRLPFADNRFEVVLSKDTLEHFREPWTAVREVLRVLEPGGRFFIVVPFLHPFHATDYYRYTPLALREMLADFEILRFDSPLWVFSVLGMMLEEPLRRLRLPRVADLLRQACRGLDRRLTAGRKEPAALAAAYRIVARKPLAPVS